MKATEAFNETGMVCRSHNGAIAVRGYGENIHGFSEDGRSWVQSVFALADTWTRIGNIRDLGPVTNLDDLPRMHVPIGPPVSDDDGWTQESTTAIPESSLTSRCLVRESEDDTMAKLYHDAAAKVDQLTARVAELEDMNSKQTKKIVSLVQDRQAANRDYATVKTQATALIEKLEAELSSLREQQTLGEPLTWEAIVDREPQQLYLSRGKGKAHAWRIVHGYDISHPFLEVFDYWPWTPPALPSPVEEVPVTIALTERERKAVQELCEWLEMSEAQVMRHAISLYQLHTSRARSGETCRWSGDSQRAAEFAGSALQQGASDAQ